MNFRHLFVFFLSFFSVQSAFSQNTLRLEGRIVNENKEALPYANVSLHKAQDSALLKATLTDSLGLFAFENIPISAYFLKMSCVGHQGLVKEVIILENNLVAFAEYQLAPNSQLEGVTVLSKKNFIERKIDRTVIVPDALISNAGLSALEVMEKAPGLQINEDGNIQLIGRSGVMIFLDGKPSYMAADALANYLRGLPAGSIEAIEIMPVPPAQFDAAGSAGAINIKLKKNIQKGLNGGLSLSLRQGFYGRTTNSLHLNYRVNKLNLFSNLNYSVIRQLQDINIYRNYLGDTGNLQAQLSQNSFLKDLITNLNGRVGFDYYLNEKSTIGAVVAAGLDRKENLTTNRALLKNARLELDSTNVGISTADQGWQNLNSNINYSYKIGKKGREISANADYLIYQAEIEQTLSNSATRPDGNTSTQDKLLGQLPASIDIKTAKIDYTNPIKAGFWALGAKTSAVNAQNTAEFFNETKEGLVPNTTLTNYYNYEERIHAAYLNLNKSFGKLGCQLGLRAENTNIAGLQYGNPTLKDSTFERHYTSFFPTVFFTYQVDSLSHHVLGFSFGRRINRPDYQMLNPFSYPMDRYTIYSGNPFLLPTYSQTLELSHTYKGIFTTTLFYDLTSDMITETIEIQDVFFYSRPGNIGEQQTFALSINGNLPLSTWWQAQVYAELNHSRFASRIYGQKLVNNGTLFTTNLSNQFNFNQQWSAEVGFFYQSTGYHAQFVMIPTWRINTTLQKKIMKGKGSLKLSCTDIFYTFKRGGDIRALDQATASYTNQLDTRAVSLTFGYNFRKGNVLRVRQSGASEEERQRIGR